MKGKFSKSEVISYLETSILWETADEWEQVVYLNLKWFGNLEKDKKAFNHVLKNMKDEYGGE